MKLRMVLSLAVAFASVLPVGAARASYSEYFKLSGVTGESNPPGFTDATKIHTFTISGNGGNTFTETQLYDSSSPQIAGKNSLFTEGTVAFYKDPNTATAPYEEIQFHDLLVSSIVNATIDSQLAQRVTFQFVSPADYLYLALPGVNGSSSAPGRTNLIPIDSLTISDNTFSVHKAVDAASPALAAALLNGAAFTTSSLLIYTNIASETQPDFSIVFDHALISSIVADSGGGDRLGETISFVGTDANVVPEPGPLALLALGALAGATARMRRRPA
jgi:type VI protein secretion system component Hcp